MTRYLLDTCICVFLFRQKYNVAEKLSKLDPSQCYVSEVTIAILTNGARFKRDERFNQLSPIYQQTAEDIECYIKECLSQSK